MQLEVEFINTGFCSVPEALLMTGGRWTWIRQPFLVGLIRHPTRGNWLIDTGVSPRLGLGWSRLFLALTRLHMIAWKPSVPVSGVLLSHWHLDHVGGLLDFPHLPLMVSRVGFEAAYQIKRPVWLSELWQLIAGYQQGLLPQDISLRTHWLEDLPLVPVSSEFQGRDLFGDGSVMAVPLPGHAAGQHGFWLESIKLFYVADAIGHNKMLEDGIEPRAPQLIADDRTAERETRLKLRRLSSERPDLQIVCCHSPLQY